MRPRKSSWKLGETVTADFPNLRSKPDERNTVVLVSVPVNVSQVTRCRPASQVLNSSTLDIYTVLRLDSKSLPRYNMRMLLALSCTTCTVQQDQEWRALQCTAVLPRHDYGSVSSSLVSFGLVGSGLVRAGQRLRVNSGILMHIPESPVYRARCYFFRRRGMLGSPWTWI